MPWTPKFFLDAAPAVGTVQYSVQMDGDVQQGHDESCMTSVPVPAPCLQTSAVPMHAAIAEAL